MCTACARARRHGRAYTLDRHWARSSTLTLRSVADMALRQNIGRLLAAMVASACMCKGVVGMWDARGMHAEIQIMGGMSMRVGVGQCTHLDLYLNLDFAACSREMRRASASSYSSSRRVASSEGPRRKLRSDLTKVAVSAAILQPRVPYETIMVGCNPMCWGLQPIYICVVCVTAA